MILPLQQAVRAALQDTLTTLYGPEAVPATLVIETPPTRALGDLALPCAFELARTLRKAPRAIAQEIVAALPAIPGVTRVEAVGGGYINVFLDRAAFLRGHLGQPSTTATASRPKTIVEHTAINPNKAAHIGHLRNSILGDTVGRLLRFLGTPVEIQNYIDDTGVQVADVVVGFERLEGRGLDEVRALAAGEKFDYYCWDLYARVTEWYEADKSRLDIRKATLHAIEHGGNPSAEMGAVIADAIVRCHLVTMARLHIDYDLLSWEGDILRLQFWATAFDILKRNGTVYLQTGGQAEGLLGDGDRRRRRCRGRPDRRAGDRRGRGRHRGRGRRRPESAREGHRAVGRHRHLRRQGHRQPVLEVRPARPGLRLPALRQAPDGRDALGDDVHRRRRRRIRPSAAPAPSSTSSTRVSPTCRNCSSRPWRRWAIARRPSSRSICGTRWSRCRTRRHANSASRRHRRASRSSRSPGARGSA